MEGDSQLTSAALGECRFNPPQIRLWLGNPRVPVEVDASRIANNLPVAEDSMTPEKGICHLSVQLETLEWRVALS